jgi:dolichyl-phosphate beta-glucosyltransferase
MEQPEISVVVPAYQEEKRIAQTVVAFSRFLSENYPGAELIVVCDGCTDNTAGVVRENFAGDRCQLKVIELTANQGKGQAVKEGMLAAAGRYLFFTDADLSFQPQVLNSLLEPLRNGADIAISQRKKETRYPGLGRRIIASGSRFLIGNIVLPGIRDTQAGFKGFRREPAQFLFKRARIKRFLFDLEILILARRCGFKIEKVYVDWTDRAGSTVSVVVDSLRSMRDLVLILFWVATNQYDLSGGTQKATM